MTSNLEALERLARLKAEGHLTEDEFKEQKVKLLGDGPERVAETDNAFEYTKSIPASNKLSHREKWLVIEWFEIEEFVGQNSNKFYSSWLKMRERAEKGKRGQGQLGWCWPAFLLTFIWFFYRKQWLIGMAYLFFAIVVVFLPEWIKAPGVILNFIAARQAKPLYLNSAITGIYRIKIANPTGHMLALRRRGGTSTAGALLGLAILIVWISVIVVFAMGNMPKV